MKMNYAIIRRSVHILAIMENSEAFPIVPEYPLLPPKREMSPRLHLSDHQHQRASSNSTLGILRASWRKFPP